MDGQLESELKLVSEIGVTVFYAISSLSIGATHYDGKQSQSSEHELTSFVGKGK